MPYVSLRWALVWLLASCLLISCEYNKYPEGPTVSVFTARERITNDWLWKLAVENGENRTGVLRDSVLTFTPDQRIRICPRSGDGGCREGEWALVTKRSKLNLIFGASARAYEILLLRQNEMWLSFTENGENIRWELELDN